MSRPVLDHIKDVFFCTNFLILKIKFYVLYYLQVVSNKLTFRKEFRDNFVFAINLLNSVIQ